MPDDHEIDDEMVMITQLVRCIHEIKRHMVEEPNRTELERIIRENVDCITRDCVRL